MKKDEKFIEQLFEEILANAADLAKEVQDRRDRVQRLLRFHEESVAQRGDLGMEMGRLAGEATALIAEGQSAEKIFLEQDKIRVHADRLDLLIKELTEVAIPKEQAELKEVEARLQSHVKDLIRSAKVKVIELFEAKVEELANIQRVWTQGFSILRGKLMGVGVSDSPWETRSLTLFTSEALEKLVKGE